MRRRRRTGADDARPGPVFPAIPAPAPPRKVSPHGARRLTLAEAAEAAGGRVLGDARVTFSRISPVHDAGPEDLALLADRRYAGDLEACTGCALLVAAELSGLRGGPRDRIVVPDAHRAMATLLNLMYPESSPEPGVHAAAVVHPDATVCETASVGAGAVIGAGSAVGGGSSVGANSVIGEGAAVGRGCVLFPNVTLYPGTVLGDRVIVHAGARIGVDGFGYVLVGGEHAKVPQVGGCVVEDDVEIGANCTIDRGSIGETRIGAGSKLDNLVHIGHNVVVGPGSLLVAQVGIAGSTRLGEGVVLGGQAGLVGHLSIGAGARIGAQAGVISDVAAGQEVSGYPARDHRAYLRAMATLMRLPRVLKRVRRIEQRLARGGQDSADAPGDAGAPENADAPGDAE